MAKKKSADRTFEAWVELGVEIIVHDPSVIDRVLENHNEEGVPVPKGTGQRGWQDLYYPMDDAEEVIKHLAFNVVANGVEDISRLDGWADLSPSACTINVSRRLETSVTEQP